MASIEQLKKENEELKKKNKQLINSLNKQERNDKRNKKRNMFQEKSIQVSIPVISKEIEIQTDLVTEDKGIQTDTQQVVVETLNLDNDYYLIRHFKNSMPLIKKTIVCKPGVETIYTTNILFKLSPNCRKDYEFKGKLTCDTEIYLFSEEERIFTFKYLLNIIKNTNKKKRVNARLASKINITYKGIKKPYVKSHSLNLQDDYKLNIVSIEKEDQYCVYFNDYKLCSIRMKAPYFMASNTQNTLTYNE